MTELACLFPFLCAYPSFARSTLSFFSRNLFPGILWKCASGDGLQPPRRLLPRFARNLSLQLSPLKSAEARSKAYKASRRMLLALVLVSCEWAPGFSQRLP